MSSTRLKYSAALALLVVVVLLGLAAAIYQVRQGLIVTNMRNSFSWGLYIALWAFFVGTAAGGLVVTSALYLFKVERLKPFGRTASLTALLCTIAAMAMLLPDLGRPDRLLHLLRHAQFNSVLIWDFIVLGTYAVLAAVYTYVQMRPDIAAKGIRLPLLGAVGQRDLSEAELERMKRTSERQAKLIAPIALPVAILIHTVTAWVLATQLARGWWYGGALAPSFIASALASGPAVVILGSIFALRHTRGLEEAYSVLGKIAVAGAVILLFVYYNDFVVRLWWREGSDFEAARLIFGRYWPVHAAEALLMVLAIFLFVRLARSKGGLIAGSLAMTGGVLVHRFLLVPSAYNVIPFRIPSPGDGGLMEWAYPTAVGEMTAKLNSPAPVFVSFWSYVPSPVEWMVSAGLLATVVLGFVLLSAMLPMGEERS